MGSWPMSWVIAISATLVLFASYAFLRWHLWWWKRRLGVEMDYETIDILPTSDGARVEIRHLTPWKSDKLSLELSALPPVLLVHGIAANHRNQDLHPDFSLARYLAATGRDVWLLTLRSGLQKKTIRELFRVRFQAMVTYDLPLGVQTVLERTGSKSLDYIGFSMGGMLMYAAAGRTVPVEQMRRVVIIGSPGKVIPPFWMPKILRWAPLWLIPVLPLGMGAKLAAFGSEWLATPLHRLVVNPDNVSKGITKQALVDIIEDIPGALAFDFSRWMFSDGHLRLEQKLVLDGLHQITVPCMFFAGAGDKIAPVEAVREAYNAWGRTDASTNKQFVVMGKSHGSSADYGHGDLAVGSKAPEELFPQVAEFLTVN
jgi:polyhydroxyalkanoate synthase subunit PhaC